MHPERVQFNFDNAVDTAVKRRINGNMSRDRKRAMMRSKDNSMQFLLDKTKLRKDTDESAMIDDII